MKYDICVFGGCTLDQMYYQNDTNQYPDTPNIIVPGGKGSNQAVASSRAGATTTIITRIGKDEIGEFILENLAYNMVNTSNVEIIEGIENDCSKVYIDKTAKDNHIERKTGAINSFTVDMIETYKEVLLSSKIIMCQLKIPKEVTIELINFCNKHNKTIILTPCRPEKLSIASKENLDLIDKVSFITCNKKECETIFETTDIESCVKKYPNKLIVTLGKDGLIYSNGKNIINLPALNVKVADTTGAGDTFAGNLAAFISMGLDLDSSIKKAMYASALKIQKKSAQEGMPYPQELNEFIDSMTTHSRQLRKKK